VVVKFNRHERTDHMIKELKLYKKASKKYKKYLARVFGGDKKKIIQRYAHNSSNTYSEAERKKVKDLVAALKIPDCWAGRNMSKDENGVIKVYDFGGHG